MSAENRVTMTRVIVGVGVGATLALVYLYNKYQERKEKESKRESRRHSTKSGEGKKVTFKETVDGDGASATTSDRAMLENNCAGEDPAASANNSKLRNELNIQKHHLTTLTSSNVNADQAHDEPVSGEGRLDPSPAGVTTELASSVLLSTTADDAARIESSSNTTTSTNRYENNSTLKLEDSSCTTSTTINNSTIIAATPSVVKPPVIEEVITRSADGPLMTSTPLPGKESVGHVPLRVAAAVFEPHASDLQSSAQVDDTNGQASTINPETDYNASTFTKEMRIPREIVPALIGKKGCNIKGIQAQSGTTINFHDQSEYRNNILDRLL